MMNKWEPRCILEMHILCVDWLSVTTTSATEVF